MTTLLKIILAPVLNTIVFFIFADGAMTGAAWLAQTGNPALAIVALLAALAVIGATLFWLPAYLFGEIVLAPRAIADAYSPAEIQIQQEKSHG